MDVTLFSRVELNVNPLLSAIRWFVSSPGNIATYTALYTGKALKQYIYIYIQKKKRETERK